MIDQIFSKRFNGGVFLEALLKSAREGHLCLEVGDLVFPSFGEKDEEIKKEAKEISKIVVRKKNRYYLQRNWEIEEEFLKHFERLMQQKLDPIPFAHDPELDIEQNEAIATAFFHPFSLISGGPGTGKSFTAKKMIEAFSGKVAVGAPTGKATANLRGLPCTTKTVHALLSKRRLLPYDLIIIDEGSMIDADLMRRLFASVPTGARLVILGDRDQLPPIDTGHFFADLTKKAPCSYLKKCHRAELKEIVDLAAAVKKGEMIPYEPLENLPKKPKEVTLLTPLRKGPYGVDQLNALYHGENRGKVPIIITENRGGFVNGEVGYIEGEETSFGVKPQLLPNYEYAYALSVHKSQGSEYDEVWLLLPPGSERFGREVLYTAITRAKKKVRIFAAPNILEMCLEKQAKRLSLQD